NTRVTLSQLVWDFGQTSDKWRSTEASARASAQQERATGQGVLLQVRTAFFNAVAYKELLAVARETMQNQRKHLEQIQGLVRAWGVRAVDLGRSRARSGCRGRHELRMLERERRRVPHLEPVPGRAYHRRGPRGARKPRLCPRATRCPAAASACGCRSGAACDPRGEGGAVFVKKC